MIQTTPGKVILKKLLPADYKELEAPLDSKGVTTLFTDLAKRYPGEEYSQILKRLNNFGNKVATEYGGIASIHLDDLKLTPKLKAMRAQLKQKLNNIIQNPLISSEDKKRLVLDTVRKETTGIDQTVVEELNKSDNSFGLLVKTKARGNPQQLRQLVFGDLLTVDSKMRDIPYPTLRSYGEGITPLQYWTASHGGRHGYWLVQKATADAGYFSKQIRGTVHRQIITGEDCGNPNPLYVEADDSNNIGSLLFKDTKGKSGKVYTANTPINEDMLDDLPDKVAIRSAVTCGQGDGVCAHCAGIRESGKFPDIGEPVGLNGVNSFLEGLTQSGLCLHRKTLVRLANGNSKYIEKVKAGDRVLAYDKATGKIFPTEVVALHNNGLQQLYRYTVKNKNTGESFTIVCTRNHKILMRVEDRGNCSDPKVLVIGQSKGDVLPIIADYTNDNENNGYTNCEYHITTVEVYDVEESFDIEIDTKDHLFLLSNGMVVSNSSKHSGGESVATRRVKKGLDAVSQFINMPENFVGGATITDIDGVVGDVKEAPQGGKYITVSDKEFYAPADAEITVKKGDRVEAGDVLTDGMVDMSKVVMAKGIGEGRKEFLKNLAELLEDNGAGTSRKNLETFARGYIDRVEITDPDGLNGWIYGDVADYNVLERNYKPRKSAVEQDPRKIQNYYLEKPFLHYSIGTRITPRVAEDLYKNGVENVLASPEEPQFKPYMTSAKQFQPADEDWITALSGENLMRSIQEHTQRGTDSSKKSTSMYPQLAMASGWYPKPLTI